MTSFALTLGNFDGVHKGHKKLLSLICEYARQHNCLSAVMTFDPHPAQVLGKFQESFLLMNCEEKLEAIKKEGIDEVFVLPFSQEIVSLSPREFFEKYIVSLDVTFICVGENFRFGNNASGTIETLRDLCVEHSIECFSLNLESDEFEPLSSTRIRNALSQGDFEKYRELSERNPIFSFRYDEDLLLFEEDKLLPKAGKYEIKIDEEILVINLDSNHKAYLESNLEINSKQLEFIRNID